MKVLHLIGFVFFAITNGLPTGNPDFEILFKYTADFRTGIFDPHVYGSQFILKADLHGQYDADSHTATLYFSNPLISLYNGDLPMEGGGTQNLNYLPLVSDAAAFEEPFLIEYPEQSADIDAIFTENDEPKWIINIKKSVASLFQFDWKTFDMNINKTMPYTFHSEENSLYGKCLVTYTVEPEDDLWIVNKQQDPSQCSHFSSLTVSNLIETPCGNHPVNDNNIVTENRRIYQVIRNGSEPHLHIFKNIVTSGKVFFIPFRENGEVKYANVIQTVEFAEYQEPKQITFRQKIKHGIVFDFDHYNETEILFASTFSFTKSETNDSTYTNLEKCVKGIEHLSVNISDANAYNYIVRTLSHFTTDDFEICANHLISNHSDISLNHIDILYKIVPIVGTRASANFIKNVIKTSRIKSSIAVSMVEYMPFYILAPTEELLVDLIEFIDRHFEVKPDIKSAAILAYATLISKTFNSNQDSKILSNYIKIFYNNLKSADTYSDQLIWLQGLKNINIGSVLKLLLPIIKGEQLLHLNYDHNLQVQAIWGTSSLIRENQIELVNVLWPIVINRKAHPEIRVAAMHIYVKGIKSSRGLSNIFWYMQTETNQQVFNYFRTLLKTIAEGTQQCSNAMTVYAKQALSYLKNFGQDSETYAFAYDHIEQEYGFGGKIHGCQMGDSKNKPISILVNVEAYAMEKSFNLFSFYMKQKNFNIRNVLFSRLENNKDTEIIRRINNKVISAKVYRDGVIPTISDFFDDNKNKFTSVFDLFNADTILPTDIGLPIVLNFKMPIITRIELENNLPSISFKLQQSLLGNYGTALYNPFANVWHGIMREIRYFINFPIKFSKDTNISFLLDKYQNGNNLEASTNVQSVVFLSHPDNTSVLFDYCPHCTFYKSVTEDYKNKINFEKIVPLEEIGLDYNFKVADCTGYYNGLAYTDATKISDLSDLNSVSWPKFGIYFFNLIGLHFLSPKIHSCSQTLTITKSNVYPAEAILLELMESDERYNAHNVIARVTILTTDKSKTRTWDADFSFQSSSKYHLQLSRTIEEQSILNLCFDYHNEILTEMESGKFTFFEGYSLQKECSKDNFTLQVNWEGLRSTEQLSNGTLNYRDCASNAEFFSVSPLLSNACMAAHTSLRNYTYNIEYKNTLSRENLILNSIWDLVKNSYNYETKHETNDIIGPDKLLIEMTQPIHYENTHADVKIHFPHITYSFENVNYFDFLFPFGNTHKLPKVWSSCIVRADNNISLDYSYLEAFIPENNKWFNLSSGYDWDLSVKRDDQNNLEIKINIQELSMTVSYDETRNPKFIYDMNNEMQESINKKDNPSNIKIQLIQDSFVCLSTELYLAVIFNGKSIKTLFGPLENGLCFDSYKIAAYNAK